MTRRTQRCLLSPDLTLLSVGRAPRAKKAFVRPRQCSAAKHRERYSPHHAMFVCARNFVVLARLRWPVRFCLGTEFLLEQRFGSDFVDWACPSESRLVSQVVIPAVSKSRSSIAAQPRVRHRNTPLTGRLRMFFGVPREHPAKIRKPVEVTQNLRVEIFLSGAERRDVPLCASACCAGKIQCRRNRCCTGHNPVFGIQRFILLKVENDRSDPIDHL